MSSRTRWISKNLVAHLRNHHTGLCKQLCERVQLEDRYASNIENDLRAQGEYKLADRFLETLDEIGPGEPVRCVYEDRRGERCPNWVSFGYRANGKVYCDEHAGL